MGGFGFGKNLFSSLNKTLTQKSKMPLEEAARNAPDKMGCYKLYCDGALKYVGKAEYGLRHRFVQYYNGTTTGYSSGRMIYENRDRIIASWTICRTSAECRSLEAMWIRRFKPEWNVQSGWKNY